MGKRNLKKIIRRLYIPRLVFPLAVFIATTIILVMNPFDHNLQLVNVKDISRVDKLYADDSQYVHIHADSLMYSGSDYNVGGATKARVYYTLYDNKCYFFIISVEKLPADYETLTDITLNARLIHNHTMYDKLISSTAEALRLNSPGLNSISSDVLISQYDYSHGLTSFYLVSLVVINILSLIYAILCAIIICMPELSTFVFHLRKYGNKKTLFTIAETEFDTAVATGRKNIFITDTFLISISAADVIIIPLENIVWVYEYNELRRSHGGKKMFHPLCIVTDHKQLFKIHHVSQPVCEIIINSLQNRFPEIMVGYNNRVD